MIDTLVFDFDGVIIDTETPDYVSWQEAYLQHGAELELELWGQFIGGGNVFDVYDHLENLIGEPVDREKLREAQRRRFYEMIDSNPVLPGVVDYIEEAKSRGLKLGVASSSSRDWVEGHLRSRSLFGHFDVIRGRDDVTEVKPNPELYASAVERLGSLPGNALAIEDSANGLAAAKSAGLFCVVVPNPMTEHLNTHHADMRLSSLADIPLPELVSRLENGVTGA